MTSGGTGHADLRDAAVPASVDDDRFAVSRSADGSYRLSGALVLDNAHAALQTLMDVVRDEHGAVLLDLGEIRRVDSVGLALLIESMRLARRRALQLRFRRLPAQFEALVAVSGVEAMLPRTDRVPGAVSSD